jgi:hypothetical protein
MLAIRKLETTIQLNDSNVTVGSAVQEGHFDITSDRGTQILVARFLGRLCFVSWSLTFVGPQYKTYFLSPI